VIDILQRDYLNGEVIRIDGGLRLGWTDVDAHPS